MSEDDDLLSALPLDLQLHIADAVGERCDRAALALASPRLLGLAACRELPSYQGLEMSLAFHHVLGGAIDEQPHAAPWRRPRAASGWREGEGCILQLACERRRGSVWRSSRTLSSGTSCSLTASSARCCAKGGQFVARRVAAPRTTTRVRRRRQSRHRFHHRRPRRHRRRRQARRRRRLMASRCRQARRARRRFRPCRRSRLAAWT